MACPSLFMKALALVLIAAYVAAKCPHKQDWKSLEGQTSELNITIGTSNRTYLLHIPEGFSTNENEVGVVFSYHDEHRDAYHQEKISGFSDPIHNSKYIAVYPQATDGTWYPGRSSGGNHTDDPTTNPDDHIYTSAILKQLYATRGLCLDSTQAYATGMGNGSSFVHHLNCRNNHDPPFQAFAGAGGIPQSLDISPDRCFQAGIKPLLMIHGTGHNEHTKFKNPTSTTFSNLTELSLAAAWALAGGFMNRSGPIISLEASEGLKFNWTKWYRILNNPDAAVKGAIVKLYKFPFADHIWESKFQTTSSSKGPPEADGTNSTEPDVTKIIMEFFKDEHCVLQRMNNRKCSAAGQLRPAAVVMAVTLMLFFLLLWSTPTF